MSSLSLGRRAFAGEVQHELRSCCHFAALGALLAALGGARGGSLPGDHRSPREVGRGGLGSGKVRWRRPVRRLKASI